MTHSGNRLYCCLIAGGTDEDRNEIVSNADKIRNAATMFGTGSAQHLAAIKRFGAK